MKKLFIAGLIVFLSAGAFADHFTIADPNGGSLEPGDIIEIADSNTFPASYWYSDAHYRLYYSGTQIARVHVPFDQQFFDLSDTTYKIEGYGNLYVGSYIWTDEIEVEIQLATFGKPQYTFDSTNTLPVNPQGPVAPSISVYGIVLLVAGISLYLYNKR